MANLKEVRMRISSVNSTKQITSAMKMVAASKLRKSQCAIVHIRPYMKKLNDLLYSIGEAEDIHEKLNYYAKDRGQDKVLLVVLASNRGLCGAFNANTVKLAKQQIEGKYADSKVDVITFGKKATERFSKCKDSFRAAYDDVLARLQFEDVMPIANDILAAFDKGQYDKVEIVYNRFNNAVSQQLVTEQWLPVNWAQSSFKHHQPTENPHEFLFEPSKPALLKTLLPAILRSRFYRMLLDSSASEHGARMTAMQKATDNAQDMLRELRLTYNKARQAAITSEILEIVSGAEALNKGE